MLPHQPKDIPMLEITAPGYTGSYGVIITTCRKKLILFLKHVLEEKRKRGAPLYGKRMQAQGKPNKSSYASPSSSGNKNPACLTRYTDR